MKTTSRFSNYAWFVLLYNLPVVAWGAFVRLSFSGDGCGSSWPDCGGTLLPIGLASSERMIEYVHRMSTGLDGLFIFLLAILTFLRFKRSKSENPAKPDVVPGSKWELGAGLAALFFTGVEFFIGARLVLEGWVGLDASSARAVTLGLHLVNTLLLLGSLSLVALWSSGATKPNLKKQGAVGWLLAIGVISLMLVSASGAITSLGDKLFPVSSTPKAITDALDGSKHFLVQLRILHPLIATCVGVLMVLTTGLISHLRPSALGNKVARGIIIGYGAQIALGLLNVVAKAPNWMAILHLTLSNVIFITFFLWSALCLGEDVQRVELNHAPNPDAGKATIKDFVVLTKPKVISLLLFTTLTALFASAQGAPSLGLFLAVALGGYMAAGAANAINMVIDRDIDGSMKRTAQRPTVTQRISSTNALFFSFALALGSFILLWTVANLLAAVLALAGLAFYVVIYTLMLKRRTWHNIVIGGAAGAFPPLVGWAAFSGELTPMAWVLFAIIFVWTPVHFWALALMIKDDYANANVPMLPVVHGDRATVIQIAIYGVITAAVSLMPYFMKPIGGGPTVDMLYLGTAVLLNIVLLVRCFQLMKVTDRPHALKLYKFSMLYLAILFLIFAVDCSIPKNSNPVATARFNSEFVGKR